MDYRAIIDGLRSGDSQAIERIRRWIRGTFSRYHGLGDLEDIEQELLVDLLTRFQFNESLPEKRIKSYVQAAAHYRCIDRLRRSSRRQFVDIQVAGLVSRDPSAFDILDSRESTEIALKVFDEMPESCRTLWELLDKGLSYKEMSHRLGVGEGALRARVLRCRRRALELRSRLVERIDT